MLFYAIFTNTAFTKNYDSTEGSLVNIAVTKNALNNITMQ